MTRRHTLLLGTLAIVAVVAFIGWYKLFRAEPPEYFATAEEHFLYGSIGTENAQGVPYWIWVVLPRLFPEYLPGPGGYESLGFPWIEGRELPIGLSKVTIGIPRVGINCAVCHTSTYRMKAADVKPVIVPAGTSNAFDPQRYQRFLMACAADPRFTSTNILNEVGRIYKLSTLDSFLYRFAIIPFTRHALLRQKDQFHWSESRPDWGRGRIDPFNPIKFGILQQPMDDTIGNSDMEPLWNLKQHRGFSMHWDGLNTNITEVVISSAIGDGTEKRWIDHDYRHWNDGDERQTASLRRIQNYIENVAPPKYPFPVDQTLAASGKAVYDAKCASCHAFGGERTGKVIPVDEVGTDRHRFDMWTAGAAQAYNNYTNGYSWKLTHFVKSNGYVSVPMDGIWLRAPYLHNGSVPTLADLLTVPDQRPRQFVRGYDLYDPEKAGFVTAGQEAERHGTRYDTASPGNGNRGHVYGTELPDSDKRSLIEYMKTL